MKTDLLTVAQAAALIGYSVDTVQRAVRLGDLTPVDLPGQRLLRRADVVKWSKIPRRPGPKGPRK